MPDLSEAEWAQAEPTPSVDTRWIVIASGLTLFWIAVFLGAWAGGLV